MLEDLASSFDAESSCGCQNDDSRVAPLFKIVN